MAKLLKGLAGKAMQARAELGRLDAAYDTFNTAAPAHRAKVETLSSDIGELNDDLEAATRILGNSAGFSQSENPVGEIEDAGSSISSEDAKPLSQADIMAMPKRMSGV